MPGAACHALILLYLPSRASFHAVDLDFLAPCPGAAFHAFPVLRFTLLSLLSWPPSAAFDALDPAVLPPPVLRFTLLILPSWPRVPALRFTLLFLHAWSPLAAFHALDPASLASRAAFHALEPAVLAPCPDAAFHVLDPAVLAPPCCVSRS